MMKTGKKYYLTSLLLLLFFGIKAQDLKEDMLKIQETYEQYRQYELEIDYKLYSDNASNTVLEEASGKVIRSDENQYLQLAGSETIQLKDKVIAIDHENKVIIVNTLLEKRGQQLDPGNIDALRSLANETRFTALDGGLKAWDLELSDGQYETVRLVFDENRHIRKMILYFSEEYAAAVTDGMHSKPRLEITYGDIRQGPAISGEVFKTEKYITKTKKGYECTAAYSDYELLYYNESDIR